MSELLYGVNSLLIAGVLFVTMAAAVEVGHRIGRGRESTAGEAIRAHISAIQARTQHPPTRCQPMEEASGLVQR